MSRYIELFKLEEYNDNLINEVVEYIDNETSVIGYKPTDLCKRELRYVENIKDMYSSIQDCREVIDEEMNIYNKRTQAITDTERSLNEQFYC